MAFLKVSGILLSLAFLAIWLTGISHSWNYVTPEDSRTNSILPSRIIINMLPGGTNMIDFDHSISNSSSHESNNLNSDFIGSKRSEDSEEIFKDDEFEDSEYYLD